VPHPDENRVLHQIKNHISVVLGFSELLLEADLNDQARTDVMEIYKAAQAALRDLNTLREERT
jgi:hypothetical protein